MISVCCLPVVLSHHTEFITQRTWTRTQSIAMLQARRKFGLRTRQVIMEEASFIDEAERQLLGGALAEWQRKAEGDVGAAALDARIAERRLLHASAQ